LEALATAPRCGKPEAAIFVFLHPDSEIAVIIPSKRPIKPVYIFQFLALLDDIGVET